MGLRRGMGLLGNQTQLKLPKDWCSQFVVALCLYTRKGIIILRLTAP
jgi:hypothetical protein